MFGMTMASPRTKTILVIDDDKPTCEYFEALLKAEGFRIKTANGGEAAMRQIKSGPENQFDLVVLDLMMPKYSGYEVLKELQQVAYRNIPIFIATAKVLDQGTVELLNSESNVRGFWAKPIDSKIFKAKIHEILGTTSASSKPAALPSS